jgi:hypothetical protein
MLDIGSTTLIVFCMVLNNMWVGEKAEGAGGVGSELD